MKKVIFSVCVFFLLQVISYPFATFAQSEELEDNAEYEPSICERSFDEVIVESMGSFNGVLFSETKSIMEIDDDAGMILESNGILFGGDTISGIYTLSVTSDIESESSVSLSMLVGSINVVGGTIAVINFDNNDSNTPDQNLENTDFVALENDRNLEFSFDLSNDDTFSGSVAALDAITVRITPTSKCGCTEETAKNYSPDAEIDDGTCKLSSGKRSSIEGNIAPSRVPIADDEGEAGNNSDGNGGDMGSDSDDTGDGNGDGNKDIEDIIDAVIDDEMMECNETQYILARRAMLQSESYETVYIIPEYYTQLLGEKAINELNSKVEVMRLMSPIERNAIIESIVCKIEALKGDRNLKYVNIGAPAQGNAADYLSQYLQDMMVLGYMGN